MLVLIVVLAASVASASALARGGRSGHGHRHVRTGVLLAPIVASRPFFPAPYSSYPYYGPVSAIPAAAPASAQQGAAAVPAHGSLFPRYCPAMNAWYPDVSQCPGGWQEIPVELPRN